MGLQTDSQRRARGGCVKAATAVEFLSLWELLWMGAEGGNVFFRLVLDIHR